MRPLSALLCATLVAGSASALVQPFGPPFAQVAEVAYGPDTLIELDARGPCTLPCKVALFVYTPAGGILGSAIASVADDGTVVAFTAGGATYWADADPTGPGAAVVVAHLGVRPHSAAPDGSRAYAVVFSSSPLAAIDVQDGSVLAEGKGGAHFLSALDLARGRLAALAIEPGGTVGGGADWEAKAHSAFFFGPAIAVGYQRHGPQGAEGTPSGIPLVDVAVGPAGRHGFSAPVIYQGSGYVAAWADIPLG